MSVVEDVIAEARETTNRVARTFSIATRLLPRDVRDDVYCLYLVFPTLDDPVDFGRPDARRRVRVAEVDEVVERAEHEVEPVDVVADLARQQAARDRERPRDPARRVARLGERGVRLRHGRPP